MITIDILSFIIGVICGLIITFTIIGLLVILDPYHDL